MTALFKGLLMGVMVSAPVGPIGILCIQYALQRGFFYALMAGIGAALADTLFSAFAGFGVDIATEWLHNHCMMIQIGGGAVVAFLGLQIWLNADTPTKTLPYRPSTDGLAVLGSTFLLTLANPLTALAFIALFSTFHDCSQGLDWMSTLLTIIGVFFGSLCWWIVLAFFAARMGKKMREPSLAKIRKGIGLSLLVFGILACICHW